MLYRPDHPEAARIDAFAPLWTLPLVAGVVGAGFSVVPGIVWVAWLRRRGAVTAADTVTRGFRRALGVLLIGAGGVLLAFALGIVAAAQSPSGSRILATTMGVLLVACGLQVGQWVAPGSRLSRVCGSVVVTAMAVMFGWVAVFGDAAGFHGGMSVGGIGVTSGGSAGTARILFGVASVLTGLAASWAWKQVFRSR